MVKVAPGESVPTLRYPVVISMIIVKVTFVINSQDSLILLFELGFQQIQWIGAIVIGRYFACLTYIVTAKRGGVMAIRISPEGRELDFSKIKKAH